jgi:hypothetical protein
MLRMLTWDRMGPLGESGGPSVGKRGESDVESRDLQSHNPQSVLVKDRWVGPCEQVLNVLSHVGDMGSVNWCSLLFNRCLRETRWDLWIGQLACWECSWEPFFLGAVTLSNSFGLAWKVATSGDCPQEAYEWCTWTGASIVCVVYTRFPLSGVHWFKLPQLVDMSNRLSCGLQHVDNLMELMVV